MIAKKYIVFDIGKKKILTAVLKTGRNGYKFLNLIELKNPHNQKKIEKILTTYCLAARKKYWTKKVAISAAHLVDAEKKIVSQGKSCYGTDTFSFLFLEKEGFLVKIENDGRCFALGEYHFGKGQRTKSVFTMTLGTEIGGGFVAHGKNFQGAYNSALEVTHIGANLLDSWQDWGILCAGKGIENAYRKSTGLKLSAEEIFKKANHGDNAAKDATEKTANILGLGTASLVNILDPEMIVFGGSVSKQKKYIYQAIKIARKNIFNKKANYKFAISSLKNKANLLGAAVNFGKKHLF